MKVFGIGKNTTYFSLALIIQKVLSFVYFYFLSSYISPDVIGRYVFALSYTSFFSIFIELGLTPILIREASKYPEKSNQYIRSVFALKIPLAVIAALFAFLFIVITDISQETKNLVYLASIIMIVDSFTVSLWGILRSFQNMFYESIATIFVQIVIFTFGVTALFLSGNIKLIMFALVIASICNFLFSYCVVRYKLKFSLIPSWDKEVIQYLLRIVPAFAFGGIFIKIYNTADSVLLGFLSSDKAVGLYSIPAKTITAAAQIIPFAFSAALFPLFSRHYLESRERLKKTFHISISYLLIISLPLSAGLFVFIPLIIEKIWPSYLEITVTFKIMSLAIPFIFMSFSTGYLLNASDLQKKNTKNRGIMAVLTIVFNILLIPYFSYLGSGIIFLFVNVLVFILDIIAVKKVIEVQAKDFFWIFTKSVIACIIMIGGALILLKHFHFMIVAPLAAIMYFIFLILMRGLDIQSLKKRMLL